MRAPRAHVPLCPQHSYVFGTAILRVGSPTQLGVRHVDAQKCKNVRYTIHRAGSPGYIKNAVRAWADIFVYSWRPALTRHICCTAAVEPSRKAPHMQQVARRGCIAGNKQFPNSAPTVPKQFPHSSQTVPKQFPIQSPIGKT